MYNITQLYYHVAGIFVVNSSVQQPSTCYKLKIFKQHRLNSLFCNLTGNQVKVTHSSPGQTLWFLGG